MKNTKVLDVLIAIQGWCEEGKPINELCDLLGDKDNEIGRMLMLNGIADFAFKPMDGFSYQAVVNAILLYLAMRTDIRKQK